MRSVDRIPNILDRLGKIWEKYPDLRLGQLIANVISDDSVLYMLEDEELVRSLEDFYSDYCKGDEKPTL